MPGTMLGTPTIKAMLTSIVIHLRLLGHTVYAPGIALVQKKGLFGKRRIEEQHLQTNSPCQLLPGTGDCQHRTGIFRQSPK